MSNRKPDGTTRENYVYWMYNADGQVLYIGVTCKPEQRWRQHTLDNPGLTYATHHVKMRGPYIRSVALAIEFAAIREENPLFNLEVDGKHKRDLVNDLNIEARERERQKVVSRYKGLARS